MASMLRLARTRTVRICLGCEADPSENRQCCSDVLQTCLKPRSWRQGAFFAVLIAAASVLPTGAIASAVVGPATEWTQLLNNV